MFSLNVKWHARQIALAYLLRIFNVTNGVIVIPIVASFMRLKAQGINMFAPYKWPKQDLVQAVLSAFCELHWGDIFPWIFLTLLADVLIHRYVLRLDN